MKALSSIFLIASFLTSATWVNDMNAAKSKAAEENKYILINFSGSDWCGPCIRMHKEFFEAEDFQNYANDNLVLVNADFPRSKKNKLDAAQVQKNEALAEQYNKDGKFPFTVLTDAKGKVLKTWEGFPDKPLKSFITDINSTIHAKNP